MFGKKRPWKRYARIERVEFNSGDVGYRIVPTGPTSASEGAGELYTAPRYESLDAAEQFMDSWWANWWPKQIKSTRRA
jgi:hypothetical protein